MKIKIEDAVVVNEANIDLKKINIVGEVNSSGKTTVSKLLYSYLKSTDLPEGFSNINSENIKFTSI